MSDKVISKSLHELAKFVDGELLGDGSTLINCAADLASAGPDSISFLYDKKKTELLNSTEASAVIVTLDYAGNKLPVIKVKDPNLAFAKIHTLFVEQPYKAAGVSASSSIGKDCLIPREVTIGPKCVLGDGVELGARVYIHPGVVIGDKVKIGDDSLIYPNVTVYSGCQLGRRVIVHSGTVIGADGFGYATAATGEHVKRPHVGRVIVEDDVEIGANACVDRGTFGNTVIRKGAKIDNLVQVAHNVEIGENALLVGQSAVAGSTSIGKNVVLGGQAGLTGHIHLGDRTMVGAQSGVHNSQAAGSVVSGTPAISHRKWMKASVSIAKLPELIRDVKKIKKQLAGIIS